MLTAIQAREAVHVLLLRRLQDVQDARAVILKGGVNLRLFHGSPRYSEDIDLDGVPHARLAIHVLLPDEGTGRQALIDFLADNVDSSTLELARERALELEYPDYESLVVRFLEDDVRQEYRSQERWDHLRLSAASLVDAILERQEAGS